MKQSKEESITYQNKESNHLFINYSKLLIICIETGYSIETSNRININRENLLVTDDVMKLADFGSCRGIYSK